MKRVFANFQLINLFSVFILFLFLNQSCKKNSDVQEEVQVEIFKKHPLADKFFETQVDVSPAIQKIIDKVKSRNDVDSYVSDIITNTGLPLWDKALTNEPSQNVIEEENTNDTIYAIVPIIRSGTREVDGFLGCKVFNDSVNINYLKEKDYKSYGFNNDAAYSADKLVGLIMYLQNKIYGATTFVLSDGRLFSNDTNPDSTRKSLFRFKPITSNSANNTSNSQTMVTESFSILQVCYDLCCYHCGQLGQSPAWRCSTYCQTYQVWGAESLPTAGGGSSGSGSSGGDLGTVGGGGGGGGSEGSSSTQSLLTQILGLNSTQENFLWLYRDISEETWTYIHNADGAFSSIEKKAIAIQQIQLLMSSNDYLNFCLGQNVLRYSNWGWSTFWFNQLCIEGTEPILYSNIQSLKLRPAQSYYLLNNPAINSQINQFLTANNNSAESKFQAKESINNALKGNPFLIVPFVLTPTTPIFDAGGGNGAKPITNIEKYIKCFTNNDNKPVSGYKFAVFAEQPGPGTRKIYTGTQVTPNPGHSFIMIERTYTDGTKNNIVIGFYPNSPVNAVINQNTLGKLMDNEEHDYNVKVELEIDKSKFDQIIAYIKSKETATYSLQTYNCTDFAIEASKLAGVNFQKTSGCWYENSCGVSPANLGQDMIEMKFTTNSPANRISFPSMTQANSGDGPCN